MFAFSIAAALLAVQPAQVPQEDDIVITGELPETEHEKVKSVVRALADAPTKGQIPRFHREICPYVVGLPKEQGDAVKARIRRVSDAVGLGAAEQPCKANLMLVITDDRNALFKTWLKEHPKIFYGYEPADIRRIRRTKGPVAAWQIIVQADRDLDPLPVDSLSGYTVNESIQSASRIRNVQRPDVRAAVVVVDKTAATGLTVPQLADHVLMRALVKMDGDAVEELNTPSILHLFGDIIAGREPAFSVTQYDAAFLEALHATDNLRYASQHRAAMRNEMAKALAEQMDAAEAAEADPE